MNDQPSTGLVVGSVSHVARTQNLPMAQVWVDVDIIVLVDCSGSMSARDSAGGRTRYEQACRELEHLQARHPGKIGLFSFNDSVGFCPAGVPWPPCGRTNLAEALAWIRRADVDGMRFIVISDGDPDHEANALAAAHRFRSPIDCIYVGNEASPDGRDFLQRLAAASRGRVVTAGAAIGLADTIQRLALPNKETPS